MRQHDERWLVAMHTAESLFSSSMQGEMLTTLVDPAVCCVEPQGRVAHPHPTDQLPA